MGDISQLVGGRYRVDLELFRGPGAQSLLVTDLRNGRPCVLRQLSVAEVSPAAARRFDAQAAILARLNHPGLPRFIDGFSEGEGAAARRVVVTSYHPGESLERLVAKGRLLSEPQALLLMRRMVSVLVYLHAFEPPLVHRTISATGIVIGPDRRPCFTDLDYAGAEQATPSLELAPPGPDELALAAPEVFMGGAVPASDIYALGLAICRGMTGGDPAALLREGAKGQLRDALGVSEAFATVLARMLEAAPERRYADARALDADLARLAGVRVVSGQQLAVQEAEEPRPRRSARPLIIAGVALALVGLAALALRLSNQPVPTTSLLVAPVLQEQASEPSVPGAAAEAPVGASAPALSAPVPGPEQPSAAASPPELPLSAPPPAAVSPVVAEGRLLFDGKPFANPAAPAPVFWFREERKKTTVKPQVDYAAGAFTVRGLSPGPYGMSVRIDLEPGNPIMFPGDLTAWVEFTLEAGRPASLEAPLRTVMRLLQPVDSGVVINGWDVPCGAGNVRPGKFLFSWDELAPGTRYDVSVDRLLCGRDHASAGRVLARSTTAASLSVDLPPNQEGECYSFRLSASRGGQRVGIMTTHGKTGISWDLKFSVSK